MPVIEKRYAEALANVCKDNAELDLKIKNFTDFMSLIAESTDLRSLLFENNVHNSIKKESLQKVFNEELDKNIKNLVFILLDKGRIGELTSIYKEFLNIANKRKDILNIRIMSAQSLSTEQIDKIRDIYLKQYGKKSAEVELVVDKTLIGGLRVQIGDKVVDYTVKSRIDELAKLTGAKLTN